MTPARPAKSFLLLACMAAWLPLVGCNGQAGGTGSASTGDILGAAGQMVVQAGQAVGAAFAGRGDKNGKVAQDIATGVGAVGSSLVQNSGTAGAAIDGTGNGTTAQTGPATAQNDGVSTTADQTQDASDINEQVLAQETKVQELEDELELAQNDQGDRTPQAIEADLDAARAELTGLQEDLANAQ